MSYVTLMSWYCACMPCCMKMQVANSRAQAIQFLTHLTEVAGKGPRQSVSGVSMFALTAGGRMATGKIRARMPRKHLHVVWAVSCWAVKPWSSIRTASLGSSCTSSLGRPSMHLLVHPSSCELVLVHLEHWTGQAAVQCWILACGHPRILTVSLIWYRIQSLLSDTHTHRRAWAGFSLTACKLERLSSVSRPSEQEVGLGLQMRHTPRKGCRETRTGLLSSIRSCVASAFQHF